jgi:hypothetical protein
MTDLENRIRDELRDGHWDLPAWPDPMPRIRRSARLRLARLSLVAFVVIAVVAAPVVVLRHHGTSEASWNGATVSSVPTSSWRPGDPSMLALTIGTLDSGTYRGTWCVWLTGRSGSGRFPIVWPAGFRAKRHPLELLNPQGRVVARGGELIKLGGGLAPVRHQPCMLGHSEAFYAMSYPVRVSK